MTPRVKLKGHQNGDATLLQLGEWKKTLYFTDIYFDT